MAKVVKNRQEKVLITEENVSSFGANIEELARHAWAEGVDVWYVKGSNGQVQITMAERDICLNYWPNSRKRSATASVGGHSYFSQRYVTPERAVSLVVNGLPKQ